MTQRDFDLEVHSTTDHTVRVIRVQHTTETQQADYQPVEMKLRVRRQLKAALAAQKAGQERFRIQLDDQPALEMDISRAISLLRDADLAADEAKG